MVALETIYSIGIIPGSKILKNAAQIQEEKKEVEFDIVVETCTDYKEDL